MTCVDFQKYKGTMRSDVTSAVVAALFAHVRSCPDCYAETKQIALATIAKQSMRTRLAVRAAALRDFDENMKDPEFAEVVTGVKPPLPKDAPERMVNDETI